MTQPQLLPKGIAHTEWTLRALDGLGLDASASRTGHWHDGSRMDGDTLFEFGLQRILDGYAALINAHDRR
jgi:hypothetical protein